MLYLLNSPFILDFAVILSLFILCSLVVFGAKAVVLYIQALFFTRVRQFTKRSKKPTTMKKVIKRRAPSHVRSIEINPDEIDRIYVKKIS